MAYVEPIFALLLVAATEVVRHSKLGLCRTRGSEHVFCVGAARVEVRENHSSAKLISSQSSVDISELTVR
jgi:hypothetical protein